MSKFKSVFVSFVVLLLMAVAAVAQTQTSQPQPDAKELLRKVHENYANIKTFHFEGQSVMEMKGDGIFMRMEMPFAVAAGKNGQRLMKMKIFSVNTFQVSDGQTEWVYMPTDKQYTKKPVDKESISDDVRHSLGKSEAMKLATISDEQMKELKTARIVREESLEVGGQRINCYVIEADFGLDEAQAASAKTLPVKEAPSSISMTFWVDKERSLILKSVLDGGGAMAEIFKIFGDGAGFKMTSTMNVAKVNESLSDSLFAFTPPADAKEVEKFDSKLAGLVEEDEPETESLVGTDAVSFSLADLNGKQFSMDKLRGKIVVIDFWASWCGPCRETMPHVEKLHKEFKDKGVVVIGINDEEIADAKRFVQKYGYTFPTLIDAEGSVSKQYGIQAIPQTFVIDRDGKIMAQFMGTGQEENLRETVKVLLAVKAQNNSGSAKKQIAKR